MYFYELFTHNYARCLINDCGFIKLIAITTAPEIIINTIEIITTLSSDKRLDKRPAKGATTVTQIEIKAKVSENSKALNS